jgi:hypothetical protein
MVTIFAGERQALPDEPLPAPNSWMLACPATDEELIRLLVLVRQKVPQHVPLNNADMAALIVKRSDSDEAKQNAARLLLPFKAAFTFCHQLGRTETANRQFFSSHWGERCLEWCRANHAPREPSDAFVFAAAVAQCDVAYALRSDAWSSALGFAEYGGRRAGYVPVLADILGNTKLVEVDLPWRALLRKERQLRESEVPPQLDRDPTSVSHKHRLDSPQKWSSLEPWSPGV